MLRQRIEQDVKAALLAHDSMRVSVLRSLKSAITYAEVAQGVKGGDGLTNDAIIEVLTKESKKRQESADIFRKNGQTERADQESQEKEIIEQYLPSVVSETDLTVLIDQTVNRMGVSGLQSMGAVMSEIKKEAQGRVDGALAARIVKERLQKQ